MLFDSRPTVAWPPTTVAWPFSDFFQNMSQIAWNVQKTLFDSRPTVAWPRPLSRDRSATFFKIFPNRLKRLKNVVWQSADGRVTSTTVAWPFSDFFSKFSQIAWNVQKTLFWQSADGRVTSTTVAWPFSDFFQNFPKSLGTSKKRWLTVGRRSRDLNHCRVTVQRLFSKFPQIAWNVLNMLFDSRPKVAWPPTTVAWPFSDFFQNISQIAWKRPKNVVWQSADGRVTSDHCRVTVSATFFKKISNCLKRRKIVVWQSADGRVTSDHSRTPSHTASQMYISFLLFLCTWKLMQKWRIYNTRRRETLLLANTKFGWR